MDISRRTDDKKHKNVAKFFFMFCGFMPQNMVFCRTRIRWKSSVAPPPEKTVRLDGRQEWRTENVVQGQSFMKVSQLVVKGPG